MRLPIKAKIGMASTATVALVTGLILYVVKAQHSVVGMMNEMVEKNMATMRLAEQLKYDVVLSDNLVFRYLTTEDKVLLAESERIRGKVQSTLQKMRDMLRGQTAQELVATLIDETALYDRDVQVLVKTHTFSTKEQKESVKNLIKAIESGSLAAAPSVQKTQKQTIALLSAEGRARLTRIYSECEKLVDISRSKLEDAQAQVQDTVVQTGRVALAAGAAVVLATVLVAFFLGLSLISPLQNLLKGVKKVTEGEFNLELAVEGNDEVGRLTQEFNAMARNLKDKQQRLLTETITDSLTGLYNFRYFQTQIKDEISRATRYKHSFTILIFDIDNFKHYNDTNGHAMGNVVLKGVADTLRDSLRKEDILARYGGEEFVAILPETDGEKARIAAERLREAIASADFPNGDKQPLGRVSVSIGGAIFPQTAEVASRLFEAADKALYAAKKAGRNRVAWAGASPASEAPAAPSEDSGHGGRAAGPKAPAA